MDPIHAAVAGFLRGAGVSRAAPLLVAVSGGADSLALLHCLVALSQRVAVAHVHHGLRGAEADADLAFVAAWAQRLGLACHAERVAADRRDGRSPEARARELRYAALESIRARHHFSHVVTAHTLDDQAETVLLRAIRGTHLEGLCGVLPELPERRLLRPLLCVTRAALREYLLARGLAWREDATNQDARIPRNRLRRDVLPQLEAIHPGAARQLAALAQEACARRAERAEELARALRELSQPGDAGIWIDAAALCARPASLRDAALAELLVRGGVGDRLSRLHLQRAAEFLAGRRQGRTLSLPGGLALLRDRRHVWLGPASGPRFPEPFRIEVVAPQEVALPERELRFVWQRSPACAAPARALPLPAELPAPLVLRSPIDGDVLAGGCGRPPLHLKEMFASARWSKRERARAVVAELAGELIWVVGLAARPRPFAAGGSGWHLVARSTLSANAPSC